MYRVQLFDYFVKDNSTEVESLPPDGVVIHFAITWRTRDSYQDQLGDCSFSSYTCVCFFEMRDFKHVKYQVLLMLISLYCFC